MAISNYYVNGDPDALAYVLQNTGLFDTVDVFSSTVTCKDSDEHVLVSFSGISNSLQITTYYNNANSSTNTSYTNLKGSIDYAYRCSNGIMFNVFQNESSKNRLGTILLTKTNNDEVAVVWTTNSMIGDAIKYTPYHAICLTDPAVNTYSYTLNIRNQNSVAPFLTNCELGKISYTPNAGYLPTKQSTFSDYGELLLGGASYLTNGYWVIKD